MTLFSKQQWFCNACGKEHLSVPFAAYGSKYNCCDKRCNDEMMRRDTYSILGKECVPWLRKVGDADE